MVKMRLFMFVSLMYILTSLCVTRSFASVYFYDNFSSNDLSKWNIDVGTSQNIWSVTDGVLKSFVVDNNSSTIYASGYTGPLQYYELKADVMNISGIDQNFFVQVSGDRKSFYQIGYRYNEPSYMNSDKNNFVLYKFINGVYSLLAKSPSADFPSSLDLTQNIKHKIKIAVQSNYIKVYFDDNLVINYYDYHPTDPSGVIGIQAYRGGSPVSVVNTYDNIIVSSVGDTWQVPVSSPTPTPPKKKIIILPGLGASWNTQAMVLNDTSSNNVWSMTSFVSNYDGLIETLKKGGMTENQDFYVWNYDWRRPVSEIVDKLNSFINQHIGTDEKVDLVGHSLGGLTARIWAQNHGNDSRLDKVIALGGPQRGSLDAYDAWNGVEIPQGDLVENIALHVLTQLQKKNEDSMVQTLRKYAPVLGDLLPTFDFAKKNGITVKVADLKSVNSYLLANNVSLGGLPENINAIVGLGVDTKEWINLGKTSIFNQILGYWPDGVPTSYGTGSGDGTVLKTSATLSSSDVQVSSKHSDLVNNNIGEIISQLGLGFTPVLDKNVDLSKDLVFYIGSPAILRINCDSGSSAVSDDSGFALVDSTNSKVCNVKIVGTGAGTYHLVTGKAGMEDSWQYYENEIGIGKSDLLYIDAKSGLPVDGQNTDFWFELILRDINLLLNQYPKNVYLKLAKDAGVKKNIDLLTEDIFNFRDSSKETIISGRIMGVLREILIGKYQKTEGNVAKVAWKITEGEKGVVDTLSTIYSSGGWKPSEFMSINYQEISDLEKDGQTSLLESKYGELLADATLMQHLITHFW